MEHNHFSYSSIHFKIGRPWLPKLPKLSVLVILSCVLVCFAPEEKAVGGGHVYEMLLIEMELSFCIVV